MKTKLLNPTHKVVSWWEYTQTVKPNRTRLLAAPRFTYVWNLKEETQHKESFRNYVGEFRFQDLNLVYTGL